MRWINLCGAACIASLLPSGASAKLIFDQSVDLTFGAQNSDDSLGFGPNQVADEFTLLSGASTITDVHWWGLYGQSNTPFPDTFFISIFADDNGTPENDSLIEFSVRAVNRVDTGVDVRNQFDVFAYSVEISPLALAANTTYWLSIQNSFNNEHTDWRWNFDRTSDTSAVVRQGEGGEGDPWVSLGDNMGFQLTNDAIAVPEPATWALFAAGLAGLGWMNRRRKAG